MSAPEIHPTEPIDPSPGASRPRVAVIGAGAVGRALADGLEAAGVPVTVGVRRPEAAARPAVTVAEALADAEVVICAVPGSAMPGFVTEHAAALDGRIVIDATNDLDPAAAAPSSVAAIAAAAPRAQVFRAWNSTGWENFAAPWFGDVRADTLYAGPDGAARAVVEALIEGLGPRPVWVGADARALRAVDGLVELWFSLAMGRGLGRHLAFRVLTPND